ncbi:MAG: alginate export family protein [Pseudomonadota bacterium]
MTLYRANKILITFFAIFAPSAVAAEENCAVGFEKLRYDDETGCFRNEQGLTGLDALKDIELAPDVVLSIGGELRERYEYTRNPVFGGDPQDENGVWLQRFTLHGDLQIGEHVRLFGQLFSAIEEGRAGGASPADRNDLTVQNAFVDFRGPIAGGEANLRLGRQELQFGSGRFVDVREGPNVRRTFDAVRPSIEIGDWRIDGLWARPRITEPGVFDDRQNDDQDLWSLYAVKNDAFIPGGTLDLYYLGFRNDNALFAQGVADEERHTLGIRHAGTAGPWDWNWEAAYQFGSFGDGDISAWTLATDTGYTFEQAPWSPRIALSTNIASGDSDPDDNDLGTFNAIFPRGNYFSEAAVLGPRNFYNLHAFLTVKPTDRLRLQTDYNLFWRLQKEDGVYGPAGNLFVPGGGDDRFVASALSFTAEYALTERIALTGIYTRVFAGDVIEATSNSDDIDFIELTFSFHF